MIYIASKTIHAPKWRELRASGYPVISTWVDEAGAGESASLSDLWIRCIREASECHVLLAYREPNELLKGTFIEIGAALASGRLVFLAGCWDLNYSFRHHPNVYPIIDDLEVQLIKARRNAEAYRQKP